MYVVYATATDGCTTSAIYYSVPCTCDARYGVLGRAFEVPTKDLETTTRTDLKTRLGLTGWLSFTLTS